MRAWGLLLAASLALPALARAEDVAVAATAVRFVDAAPRGPGVEERLGEIRRRIRAALVYPDRARRDRLEGETLVRFEIESDGTPSGVEVHLSSGMPSLDGAARRAVRDAAPLPWVYGRLEVPVRFELESRR